MVFRPCSPQPPFILVLPFLGVLWCCSMKTSSCKHMQDSGAATHFYRKFPKVFSLYYVSCHWLMVHTCVGQVGVLYSSIGFFFILCKFILFLFFHWSSWFLQQLKCNVHIQFSLYVISLSSFCHCCWTNSFPPSCESRLSCFCIQMFRCLGWSVIQQNNEFICFCSIDNWWRWFYTSWRCFNSQIQKLFLDFNKLYGFFGLLQKFKGKFYIFILGLLL